jgi:AAA ATPase domain
VGRTAELDSLAGAFVRARGGQPGVVCVEGPAGIGKTALVRAFLGTVPSLVLWASGDEDEMTLPWGVLAQLARGAQADRPGPLRKLAELSPGADPLTSGQLLLDALGPPMATPRPATPYSNAWRGASSGDGRTS